MLEATAAVEHDGSVFRLGNPERYFAAGRTFRSLDLDDVETAEAIELAVGGILQGDDKELLDAPFKRRDKGRYSNGSFPVFYSSLEPETAIGEVRHHIARELVGRGKAHEYRKYHLIECRITGRGKDVRAMLPQWPALTSDNYDFCWSVGAEAVQSGLDLLLTPSARVSSGTTVPVFRRSALKSARILDRRRIDVP